MKNPENNINVMNYSGSDDSNDTGSIVSNINIIYQKHFLIEKYFLRNLPHGYPRDLEIT